MPLTFLADQPKRKGELVERSALFLILKMEEIAKKFVLGAVVQENSYTDLSSSTNIFRGGPLILLLNHSHNTSLDLMHKFLSTIISPSPPFLNFL